MKYQAFISYSHADERWAKWLHRKLEAYRPPASLGGKDRALRVFRDREELAASGSLSASITTALADAENLIVICSPAAAASHWVNEEVRAFTALGRGERVFCLIVDGMPNDPELECLPEALRTREQGEPLGADARADADGRADAVLKILAGLLDVTFDTLKQRHLRAHNRRLALAAGGAAAGMLVLATLLAFTLISRNQALEARLAEQQQREAAETARRRAEVETASAKRVGEFLEEVFLAVDPAADGTKITALELLNESTAKLKDSYQDENPEVATRLLEVTAKIYEVLGQFDSASDQQDLHVRMVEAAYGPQSREAAEAMVRLAALTRRSGRYDDALDLLTRALAVVLDDPDAQNAKDANVFVERARVQSDAGLMADAEASYRASLERTLDRADLVEVRISALNSLGGHLTTYARPAEARPLLEESLALREDLYGPDSDEATRARNNLGATYLALGELPLAERALTRVLDTLSDRLGSAHPNTATAMNNLANVYDKQGRYEEAQALQETVLSAWREAFGRDHPDVGIALYNLGNSHLRMNDPAGALQRYDDASAVWRASLEASHPVFVNIAVSRTRAFWMAGDNHQAASTYAMAMSLAETALGDTSFVTTELQNEAPEFLIWLQNNPP